MIPQHIWIPTRTGSLVSPFLPLRHVSWPWWIMIDATSTGNFPATIFHLKWLLSDSQMKWRTLLNLSNSRWSQTTTSSSFTLEQLLTGWRIPLTSHFHGQILARKVQAWCCSSTQHPWWSSQPSPCSSYIEQGNLNYAIIYELKIILNHSLFNMRVMMA